MKTKGLQLGLFVLAQCLVSCSTDNIPVTTKSPVPQPSGTPTFDTVCNGFWLCLPSSNLSVSYWAVYPPTGAFGSATSTENKVFFAGGHEEGYIGVELDAVLILDGDLGRWLNRRLTIPRSHLAAATAGNKVLFAGGNNTYTMNPVYGYPHGHKYYNTVDIFDADNLQQSQAALSDERSDLAAVGVGNYAFFIGGKYLNGFSSKMDVYDALLDQWTTFDMPRTRAFAGAAAIGNKVYIGGGSNADGPVTIIDVYDYVTKEWSTLESPHEHPIASVVATNTKVFFAGGNGKDNRFVDVYDSESGTWDSFELSDSRYNIATASANDHIVFFGGNFDHVGEFSANVDVYDVINDKIISTKLNDGVTGVEAAAFRGQCLFTGLLYGKGYSWVESVISIRP